MHCLHTVLKWGAHESFVNSLVETLASPLVPRLGHRICGEVPQVQIGKGTSVIPTSHRPSDSLLPDTSRPARKTADEPSLEPPAHPETKIQDLQVTSVKSICPFTKLNLPVYLALPSYSGGTINSLSSLGWSFVVLLTQGRLRPMLGFNYGIVGKILPSQ
jgi:hypothetical protein